MSTNVIITAEEFKTIHNAMCDLHISIENLSGILHPEKFDRLVKARDQIKEGLAGAYKQDNDSFDAKSKHYEEVRESLGLSAVWSVFDVKNLNARHPFTGATKVHYKDHWGQPVTKEINGGTWAALFVAGNAAIRDSGDKHHIYIEQFKPSKEDASVLIMQTGS